MHKICENTGFHWPVFSRIRKEYTILPLHRRIRVSENPYSRIFYTVSILTPNNKCTKDNSSRTLKSKIWLESVVTYLSLHTFYINAIRLHQLQYVYINYNTFYINLGFFSFLYRPWWSKWRGTFINFSIFFRPTPHLIKTPLFINFSNLSLTPTPKPLSKNKFKKGTKYVVCT